jgi:hypothetical protein
LEVGTIILTPCFNLFYKVLESGTDDRQYLGQILDFSLGMLRQLGSRANEDTAKEAHQKLLSELAEISQSTNQTKSSFVFAIVKGLRFTLEEIQVHFSPPKTFFWHALLPLLCLKFLQSS